MTTAVRILQGNLPQKNLPGSVLRSGTVVSGRVISSNGAGSYTVSLAGQMIEVKSSATLSAGQVFQAKVSISGEQVALSLVQESKSTDGMVQKFQGVPQNLPPEVQNLLSSLGFEPNADSFKILQFMQQLGMKIDVPQAKKALNASKNSENRQEKAQVSLLLDEKGISSDSQKVNEVLGKNEDGSQKNEKRKKQNENLSGEKTDFKKRPVNLNNAVKKYFEAVDGAALSRENGILAAFNTVLSSSTKNPPLKHWLVFPFEWNFKNYSGTIRFLFDSDLKRLEKTIIDLKNPEKNKIFVLYYKNGELNSVRFASDSPCTESESRHQANLLASMFKNHVEVEHADFESLRGFCSDDENLSFVDGAV